MMSPLIGSINALWICHHYVHDAHILIESTIVGATLCGFSIFYGITMCLLHISESNDWCIHVNKAHRLTWLIF